MVVHSEAGWNQVESGCQGLHGHSGPHTNRSQCCHGTAEARSCPGHHTGGCGSVTQGRHAVPGRNAAGVHRASVLRWTLPEPRLRETQRRNKRQCNPFTLSSYPLSIKSFLRNVFPTIESYHDIEKQQDTNILESSILTLALLPSP